MKLTTSFDYPPIPVRTSDWSCHDSDTYDVSGYDGETGFGFSTCPVGHGATEEEAIIDFVRELCADIELPDEAGASAEYQARLHFHTCQQCDKPIGDECDCEKGNTYMTWCSANCRAAYDL